MKDGKKPPGNLERAAKGNGATRAHRPPERESPVRVNPERMRKERGMSGMQALPNSQREDPMQRGWIGDLRDQAWEAYVRNGTPTPRLEAWRYTSLKALEKLQFEAKASAVATAMTERLLDADALEAIAARLIFVNGRLASWMTLADGLDDKVQLTSLRAAIKADNQLVRQHLCSAAPMKGAEHAMTALNAARFEDGALLAVAAGVVLDRPVELIFITAPAGGPSESHLRNLIVAGRHAEVTVVERYISMDMGEHATATQAVTEVIAGEGATVRHVRVQDEALSALHLGVVGARQEANSRFESTVIQLGASLGRADVQVALRGEGASCSLDGLYVASGDQHLDNNTVIRHIAPRCDSAELYKGVLDGKSTGVFRGRVLIGEGAVKSTTAQLNRNLLMSEHATANTKPQLEIDNDDVQATHGATVGQLDAGALFYLRSRGIDEPTARSLLTWGFAREVIDRLPVPALHDLLTARLARALASNAPKENA